MNPEQLAGLILQDVEDEPAITAPEPPTRNVVVTNDDKLDLETSRRIRMGQVISKFASTLALRNIHVDTEQTNDQGVPAWSDADNIWFNQNEIGVLTEPSDVVALKGLSLHEIAHILLTPRTGSNLSKEVQREGLWRAFNALEDQRIEMFMTKRFGNVADWLSATVAKFIAGDPAQHSVAFVLTHGRKYLPRELRDQIRSMYENPQDIVELASLIDRYIVLNLNDPKNYATALDIIKRYDELVNNLVNQPNPNGWGPQVGSWDRIADPSGHHKRKGGELKSSKSKPMSKAEQDKLASRVADAVAKDGQPGNGQGNGQGDGDKTDDNTGDSQGLGATTGSGALTAIAEKVVRDVLARKSKEIATTIAQYNGDVDLTSNKVKAPPRLGWAQHNAPSPEAVVSSKSFATELARLKADFDPGWNRRTDVGRLNVQQYMSGAELDECFDEWDNGRSDAVDVECVILLDTSGSMGGVISEAYESMWAIKRAMDKINASTTVVSFNSDTELVYSADERATHLVRGSYAGGGTDALKSVMYAKSVLAESTRAIKIFIAITDGYWYDGQQCDEIIRQLRRGGVVTALAFVDTYGRDNDKEYKIDSHGCEVAVDITDARDLLKLGRSMVKAGINRNLVNG